MKKKVIIILLIVIALVVGGGIAVWKWKSKKETKSSDNSPSKKPLNQLSDKELEKCLLEDFSRRLELEKYFVFNLGELKTWEEAKTDSTNVRLISSSSSLPEHLKKIASSYLERTGEKIINNREKKKVIRFLGSDLNNVSVEWMGEKLDEKITGGKEKYIVFEKLSDKFLYLLEMYQGNNKIGLAWSKSLSLKMEHPNTHFFQNKKEALDFLKENDPTLR